MNSWDRTAYLSTIKYGTPSYEAQMNTVQNNFIIANYGASQGFDTDDGSSWYDIHDNFFFLADGCLRLTGLLLRAGVARVETMVLVALAVRAQIKMELFSPSQIHR